MDDLTSELIQGLTDRDPEASANYLADDFGNVTIDGWWRREDINAVLQEIIARHQ